MLQSSAWEDNGTDAHRQVLGTDCDVFFLYLLRAPTPTTLVLQCYQMHLPGDLQKRHGRF